MSKCIVLTISVRDNCPESHSFEVLGSKLRCSLVCGINTFSVRDGWVLGTGSGRWVGR